MELDEALAQISEIRRLMAGAVIFRGYRSITTLFSALLALVGCGVQAIWLRDDILGCLVLWASVATCSAAVAGAGMWLRCRRSGSVLQREMALMAVEQFVPCLVAGGLLTFVMGQFAPEHLWMMPGLWAVLFAMGIFASRRVLPRGTEFVGAYYLLTGLLCIALVRGDDAVFPAWTMAVTFGVGQLAAAAVLYWKLERRHERE